jgi:anthranilate synthase component 1
MKQFTKRSLTVPQKKVAIDANTNIPEVIQEFSGQFKSEKNDFKFINNGLFGYISYDAVRYFEK